MFKFANILVVLSDGQTAKLLEFVFIIYIAISDAKEDRSHIWLLSHNMDKATTDSEAEMGHHIKDFTFKLCQEVRLPDSFAAKSEAKWLQLSRKFPNKWLTYGNLQYVIQNGKDNQVRIRTTALGIHLNSGYNPESYTYIRIHGVDERCILIVHGKFYGIESYFTVANIHGDWDPNVGFKNPKNFDAIITFMKYMKTFLHRQGGHFVLAGDFNINYSNMTVLKKEIELILPDLKYPTLDSEYTTFVDGESNAVDHIISNIHIPKITTMVDPRQSDHLMLAFSVRLPYKVFPSTIVDSWPYYFECCEIEKNEEKQ